MGFDKARAPWQGWPMATVVAMTLARVCTPVTLVRRGPDDGGPWPTPEGGVLHVVRERETGPPHPLWGVAAALEFAASPVVVICPCDTPQVTPATLRRLIRAAPAVAVAGGRSHPLVGAFPVEWADVARSLAAEGAPVREFVRPAASVTVAPDELINVNRPDALPTRPVTRLRQRLAFLPRNALERVILGERARLAARGVLDPDEG